jgi:hypothetical protein
MQMNKFALVPVLATALTGCSIFSGPGSQIGWNDAIPPVSDGVGRKVEGRQLSQLTVALSPDMIEILDTYETVTTEQNSKYKAGIEAAFKKLTASAELEYVSSNSITSNRWRIAQMKSFDAAPEETEFAYKCLTADNFKYTVSRKTTAGVKLDASELVKKFDATAAKVEVGMVPNDPDKAEITVKNPNVCLAFQSAIFKRKFFGAFDGGQDFKTDEKETKFRLSSKNGVVASATADFSKRAIHTKPTYKLFATEIDKKQNLQVVVIDPVKYRNGLVVPIPELMPGTWDAEVRLPTFEVGGDWYGFMKIKIKAKRTTDGEIAVSSAQLYSPEFHLVTN